MRNDRAVVAFTDQDEIQRQVLNKGEEQASGRGHVPSW